MSETLIDHLEAYLGRITSGSSFNKGTPDQIVIARFEGGLLDECSAIGTLGLSDHLLDLRDAGRRAREELLMLFRPNVDPTPFAQMLISVAEGCLRNHRAQCQGDVTVLGPPGPLVPGSTCHALYATAPRYYPPEFAISDKPGPEPTTLLWMVPITAGEAAFVHSNGWEKFDEQLERANPNLMDLFRHSTV